MALEKEITQNRINLLVLKGEKFNDSALKITKELSKKNKIIYVSINKGFDALKSSFKNKKVDLKKFFIIDCITETLLAPEKSEFCKYISSPKSLTELSLALNEKMHENYDLVIIDSLSTLAIYHTPNALAQFINSISQKIRNTNKVIGILLISSSDAKKEVFTSNELLVDKIIHIK